MKKEDITQFLELYHNKNNKITKIRALIYNKKEDKAFKIEKTTFIRNTQKLRETLIDYEKEEDIFNVLELLDIDINNFIEIDTNEIESFITPALTPINDNYIYIYKLNEEIIKCCKKKEVSIKEKKEEAKEEQQNTKEVAPAPTKEEAKKEEAKAIAKATA